MQLADGVYGFPVDIERGDSVQTYHPSGVETEDGLLLVDTGIQGSLEPLADAMAADGFDLEDVAAVVLTHHDGDHAGCLAELLAATDAVVYAHPAETPYVDGRAHPIKSSGERYPPVPVDVNVVDGVSFRTAAGPLRVVETPGHSPGHVSLYLPWRRLLLAGDALTVQDGLSGPNEQYTPDLVEATRSVERLATLALESVHCHHGGHVAADADTVAGIHESLANDGA